MLDLLDEHLEPGPLRDRLYAHWYRTKLLSRVGHPGLTRRDADYGEALYTEIRRLAQERFDERMEKHLSFPMRLRAALLRDDRYDALEQLARLEGGLRARVRLLDVEVGPRRLKLRLRGAMAGRAEPLEWERHGEQLRLRPGGVLAQALPADRLDATRPLGNSKIDVMLRSADRGEFVVPVKAQLELRRDGVESEGDGEIEPVLVGRATINARRAAAGRPLDPGDWELFARVTLAGFQAETPIRQYTTRVPLVMRVDERARIRLVGVQRTGLGRRLVRPLGRVKGFVRRRARARSPRRR